MKIADIEVRFRDEDYININPLQTAGRTYADTRKAALAYVDGYSICDWCKGDLCTIEKPPIKSFLEDVSGFLGMDATILTNGAREAKHAVLDAITSPGDSIVVDGNRHYTTYVAAERAKLKVFEVENTGSPEYKIEAEGFKKTFEEVKSQTGTLPKACVLTHVDGSYGNLADAKGVSEICGQYNIPLLLNTAYSSGRMPVNGKDLGADFIAASCHKSWSAGGGNIGLLSVTGGWAEKILAKSMKHPAKTLAILGCSARGPQAAALMAGYPHVKERVKKWGKEVENARWLMEKLSHIGVSQYGETPTNHDLNFLSSEILYGISQTHKKKNYYLYHELKERGIIGIKPGLTKNFKISTYGKTRRQLKHILGAFTDIIEKHGP
jgi:Sep-tRNA:Cys-tRNA synthetase